jgi:hypothetical protein
LFDVDDRTGTVSNVVLATDIPDDDSSSDDPRIPECDASIRGGHEEQPEAPTDECADERIRAINSIMTKGPMFPNTPMQGPRTDDINAKISPAVDPAKSNMGRQWPTPLRTNDPPQVACVWFSAITHAVKAMC